MLAIGYLLCATAILPIIVVAMLGQVIQSEVLDLFAIAAVFAAPLMFATGTILVSVAKGYGVGLGLLFSLISPVGLLLLVFMPERKTRQLRRKDEDPVFQ